MICTIELKDLYEQQLEIKKLLEDLKSRSDLDIAVKSGGPLTAEQAQQVVKQDVNLSLDIQEKELIFHRPTPFGIQTWRVPRASA